MMRHDWHDWHGGGWGVGDWLLMGFGMLLFWVVLVALVVWVVRGTHTPRVSGYGGGVRMDRPAEPTRPTAREVLDERYARGEIGDEEYRSRRDALGS